MSTDDGSSSPMAFFASELKRLRGAAGLTQEAFASAIYTSLDTVRSIEGSRRKPSKELAADADKLFGTDGLLVRLQKLVDETWVIPWFRDLVEVERRAERIRLYEPYQIPALMQTAAYTRVMAQAKRPMLDADRVERAVELRAQRQEILGQDDPPEVWAVIEESALLRRVGDDETMRGQYAHLASLAARPSVTIQILRSSDGPTCAYGRAFIILASKSDILVYLEDIGSARYLRKRDEVNRYVLSFDHLRATALGEIQSTILISEMKEQ